MRDKVRLGVLNAYYGGMLTEHQKEIMRLHCDCDMSLAEIAEITGASRQAVREAIVRSADKLTEWEEKLGLTRKVQVLADRLERTIEGMDGKATEDVKRELAELLNGIKEI